MSPRHVPASITELQRIGLFAALPGATLARLGERMVREEVASGHRIVTEDEPTDRFYVLVSGLAGVSQEERGARTILRPGSTFGEVAPALGIARTATITAMTACVVASCDRAAFDELLAPLFTD